MARKVVAAEDVPASGSLKHTPTLPSDSEEGNPGPRLRLTQYATELSGSGDLSLNATPDICFTVSLTVVIEDTTRGYHKRAYRNHTELERRVAYSKKNLPIIPYRFTHQLGYSIVMVMCSPWSIP
jgi:hypothetical protein